MRKQREEQEAAMRKQREEVEKLKRLREASEAKAELERAMDEKLRLEAVIEVWKENFVGINGREATVDERTTEIKECYDQVKSLKLEIKKLSALSFRLENG